MSGRFPEPAPSFPDLAHDALKNAQLRRNIRKATSTIRAKTARVAAELPDWEDLREAGRATKAATLADLATHLEALEEAVTRAGGQVHWARDAAEACRITAEIAARHQARQIIKVKSMTTDEIGLNDALEAAGIAMVETDLADMIVQLADDRPSHILVPAIHRNRAEIRELFEAKLGAGALSDLPTELTKAARVYLREKFLETRFAVSGANFAIAETGSVAVFESEGNGRMCLTLPDVLVSIMGIEKVLPRWQDLEVFLQLLPRSATGERMNPYTTIWTGVCRDAEGRRDGPGEFHLVLLDNGRSAMLADEVERQTLHCIRCSRCLNVCPVYERAGGHAYHSMYQGPIGAILTPQLKGIEARSSLPFASSLCGACYEVCPVKINIPQVLVHLRARTVEARRAGGGLAGVLDGEDLAMRGALALFQRPDLLEWALWAGRFGQTPLTRDGAIPWLPPPLSRWTEARDFPALPKESFRDWWRKRA